MKIEKLTENKIRVIINLDDLQKSNTKLENIVKPSSESKNLLLNILSRAEREVGFYTEGYKLLIEAFSNSDNIFVFTITKYTSEEANKIKRSANSLYSKKLIVRKKEVNPNRTQMIYAFDSFDTFCEFCNNLNSKKDLNIDDITKHTALFLYNNTYFLTLYDIDINNEKLDLFYSSISEFAKYLSFSEYFKIKLQEHGKVIIREKAVQTGIKYFSLNK